MYINQIMSLKIVYAQYIVKIILKEEHYQI